MGIILGGCNLAVVAFMHTWHPTSLSCLSAVDERQIDCSAGLPESWSSRLRPPVPACWPAPLPGGPVAAANPPWSPAPPPPVLPVAAGGPVAPPLPPGVQERAVDAMLSHHAGAAAADAVAAVRVLIGFFCGTAPAGLGCGERSCTCSQSRAELGERHTAATGQVHVRWSWTRQ